jgi:hypothetical protein
VYLSLSNKGAWCRRVSRALVCSVLSLGPTVLDGQETGSPWTGTWRLNVTRSTIGAPLAGPSGFIVVSQTVTIEETARELRLTGETVYSDDQGQHTARDDNQLSLDGTPTHVGPVSLRLRRLDGTRSFEIISEVTLSGGHLDEVSQFAVSRDGQTLTETKRSRTRTGTQSVTTTPPS